MLSAGKRFGEVLRSGQLGAYGKKSLYREPSVTVGMTMNCPNCGLANPDTAKFCGNCGTSFSGSSAPQSGPYQSQSQYQGSSYQAYGANQPPGGVGRGNTLAKNIGIGCLIAVVIVLFFGLSCTRACLRLTHGRVYMHRRY